MAFDAKRFLQTVTDNPGVYQMYDSAGTLLYIGKAKNLKKRLSSYFTRALDSKTQALVANIANIEVTVTANEQEALLLECSLIKSHRPKFNIVLRDDKSYPYVALSKHEFPQCSYRRGNGDKKVELFGPYTSSATAKSAINFIQKVFKIRSCTDAYFKARTRPCLQFQIGRCSAPCVGKVKPERYAKDVSMAKAFLQGDNREVTEYLHQLMSDASERQNYEQAAMYRDEITRLSKMGDSQGVYAMDGDFDVIAIAEKNGVHCVTLITVQDGQASSVDQHYPIVPKDYQDDVLGAFVSQYYTNFTPPKKVYLKLDDNELAKLLSTDFVAPTKGQAKKLYNMAFKSALEGVMHRLTSKNIFHKRYKAFCELIGSSEVKHIECFDISHTMGEQTKGSCVVFDDLGPVKSEYRIFNVENAGGNDTKAMQEVVHRRYQRRMLENKDLPDLLLIDGGKGQINAALSAIESLALDIKIIGVAKGEGRKAGLEKLYVPQADGFEMIDLPPTSSALHFINFIRDEAHRFAITKHRASRAKSMKKSVLDDIPGVGSVLKSRLLKQFGGLAGLKSASIESISRVQGVSPKLAEVIYTHLHR